MVKPKQRRNRQNNHNGPDSEASDSDGESSFRPARRFQFQSFKLEGSTETWAEYKRRLMQALEHQGFATDARKKLAFLTCADAELYRLMVALCYPEVLESATVSFTDLIALLDDQLEDEVSEAMAEYMFETRVQAPGESLAKWLADLRQLAVPCRFETGLDRRLRAQLVRGVADRACRQKLLETPSLDLKQAIVIIKTHMRSKADNEALSQRPVEPEQQQQAVMYVQKESQRECYRCGRRHDPDTCWAKQVDCRGCGKFGHIQRKCRRGGDRGNIPSNEKVDGRQQRPQSVQKVNNVRPAGQAARITSQPAGEVGNQATTRASGAAAWYDSPAAGGANWEYMLCQVRSAGRYPAPDQVDLRVDGLQFTVVLDNGAPCGMMSREEFCRHWPRDRLMKDPEPLQMWSGVGEEGQRYCVMSVEIAGATKELPLLVAEGCGPFIMGRLWMDAFGFKVSGPVRVTRPKYRAVPCSSIAAPAAAVAVATDTPEATEFECFKPGLGRYRGPKMSISPPKDAQPVYLRARPVPFARQAKVEAELRRLVEIGVLESIDQSDWATPIVAVPKTDGGVRVCGDYRSTVNMVLKPEGYPLPTLEQAFAQLAGGTVFSKIDLTMAYNQVEVDDPTAMLLVINTQLGLFKVKRLWFGVSVAPPRFQKLIDGLLAGIPGVVVLLDDVLVQGKDLEEHDHRLREVLHRLSEAGFRINPVKSIFRAAEVTYLGHLVSALGIAPLPDKVEALSTRAKRYRPG